MAIDLLPDCRRRKPSDTGPTYTVYDALIRYDLEKFAPSLRGLSLAVNGANIFDKKYLTSCFANYNWCWYGNRRTVQATIGYRF